MNSVQIHQLFRIHLFILIHQLVQIRLFILIHHHQLHSHLHSHLHSRLHSCLHSRVHSRSRSSSARLLSRSLLMLNNPSPSIVKTPTKCILSSTQTKSITPSTSTPKTPSNSSASILQAVQANSLLLEYSSLRVDCPAGCYLMPEKESKHHLWLQNGLAKYLILIKTKL